jgi:hypothetical protein
VVSELTAAGHDLLHVDQAWEWLRTAIAHHLHHDRMMAIEAGAAAGLPAAVGADVAHGG